MQMIDYLKRQQGNNTTLQLDTIMFPSNSSNSSSNVGTVTRNALPASLHTGKWTPEEEEYVESLISEFRAGQLPLPERTSLRIFLSKMLNCSPMRISKKFVNSNYNGKQLYISKPNTLPPDEVKKRREKLQELEKKFLKSLSPSLNSNYDPSAPPAMANQQAQSQGGVGRVGGIEGIGAANERQQQQQQQQQHQQQQQQQQQQLSSLAESLKESQAFNRNNEQQNQIGSTTEDANEFLSLFKQYSSASQLLKAATVEAESSSSSALPSSLGAGRINRKAAAAGRALLQGFNSSHIKSSETQNAKQKPSLDQFSSIEILTELQRRMSNDQSNMLNPKNIASCSSLAELADLQRKASCENILKRSLSRTSTGSGMDPSWELAIQSLINNNTNHSTAATMPFSNHSLMSLSNLVAEGGHNNLDPLSTRLSSNALFQSARPGDVGNFLNAGDLSKNIKESTKNWSSKPTSSSAPETSANLSELMMQLSNQPLEQQRSSSQLKLSDLTGGSRTSEVNIQDLLQSIKNGNHGGGLDKAPKEESLSSQLGNLHGSLQSNLQNNLASVTSLANLFKADSLSNSVGGGLQQNQTFDKVSQKQQNSNILSDSITEYLVKQRLAQTSGAVDNGGQPTANALLDMVSKKNELLSERSLSQQALSQQALSQQTAAVLSSMNDLHNKDSKYEDFPIGGLSKDQIRKLLANNQNKRHSNADLEDANRPWKRSR